VDQHLGVALLPGVDTEVVAELAGAALSRLVGKDSRDLLGNSYRYIEDYAAKAGVSPLTACIRVMAETEKVINLILKGGEPCLPEAATAQGSGKI